MSGLPPVATASARFSPWTSYRYRLPRAALAELVEDYRAGRLDGELTLPADVRSLCRADSHYDSLG